MTTEDLRPCPLCGDELENFKKRTIEKIETMRIDYFSYLTDAEERCALFKKQAYRFQQENSRLREALRQIAIGDVNQTVHARAALSPETGGV